MYKKVNVVMLPTKDKNSKLIYSDAYAGVRNILVYQNNYLHKNDRKHHLRERLHLYITSDDEIKEGDWVIGINPISYGHIDTVKKGEKVGNCYGKIIATTDSSLTIGEEYSWKNRKDILYPNTLPQPSQSFIEKYVEEYNKGSVITEVLVEYDEIDTCDGGCITCDYTCKQYLKLKVNSKDNTITIKKVKDSWSTKEVVELLKNLYDSIISDESGNMEILINGFWKSGNKEFPNTTQDVNKWIEENL